MLNKLLIFASLSLISFSIIQYSFSKELLEERFDHHGYSWLDIQTGKNSLSATACKECHQKVYSEWKVSRHGVAWTNKGFQEGYELETQDRCIFCFLGDVHLYKLYFLFQPYLQAEQLCD